MEFEAIVVCPVPVCKMFICAPIGKATLELSGTVKLFADAFNTSTNLPLSANTNVYEATCAFVAKLTTGAVNVLFVNVWAVLKSAVMAVLIESVTAPDVPPPDKPVPAVTSVMSPGFGDVHTKSMSVLLFLARIWPVVPPNKSAIDVATA